MQNFSTLFRQQIKSFQPRLTSIREEGRVTKTLGTVKVGFTFCWLPACITQCLDRCTLHTGSWSILVALSTPFEYGATNRRFRREGKVILRKAFRVSGAALLRGRRLLTFPLHVLRLFGGGAYSS